MTKQQEKFAGLLINKAYELKDKKGHYAIDFLKNGHSVLENIVLKWEKSEHEKHDYSLFKECMHGFIAALEAETPEELKLETYIKPTGRDIVELTYWGNCNCYWSKQGKSDTPDSLIWELLRLCPGFARLLIENKDALEDAELLRDFDLPTLSAEGKAARRETLANLQTVMEICGYKRRIVRSGIIPGYLTIYTFIKEN